MTYVPNDKKPPVGIIGARVEAVADFDRNARKFGLHNIVKFARGNDVIEFLRDKKLDTLYVISPLHDMHWLSFIRRLRADQEAHFVQVVLVLEKTETVDPATMDTLRQYQVLKVYNANLGAGALVKDVDGNKSATSDSDSLAAQLGTAKDLYKQGLIRQAQQAYENILALAEGGEHLAHTGLAHVYADDLNRQRQHLEAVIAKDPENYSFQFVLLNNALKSGNTAKFASIVQELQTKMTGTTETFWLRELGELCLAVGVTEYGESIARMLLRDPAASAAGEAHTLMARVFFAQNNLDEAARHARLAMESSGQDEPAILNLMAIIERRRGSHRKALQLFQKAFVDRPMDYRILFNIALCHYSLNELEESAEATRKVLVADPDFAKAKQLLAQLDSAMANAAKDSNGRQ